MYYLKVNARCLQGNFSVIIQTGINKHTHRGKMYAITSGKQTKEIIVSNMYTGIHTKIENEEKLTLITIAFRN